MCLPSRLVNGRSAERLLTSCIRLTHFGAMHEELMTTAVTAVTKQGTSLALTLSRTIQLNRQTDTLLRGTRQPGHLDRFGISDEELTQVHAKPVQYLLHKQCAFLHSMQTLNNTSTAKTLDTFDFSTLYTTIPHHSLKNSMKHLIEEAFKVRGALYLSITESVFGTLIINLIAILQCLNFWTWLII